MCRYASQATQQQLCNQDTHLNQQPPQVEGHKNPLTNSICNTVNGINFVGYQFSWFSWRVRSTNFSTNEMVIFCMNYERKDNGHEFWTPRLCHFFQSTKIGTHENNAIHNNSEDIPTVFTWAVTGAPSCTVFILFLEGRFLSPNAGGRFFFSGTSCLPC